MHADILGITEEEYMTYQQGKDPETGQRLKFSNDSFYGSHSLFEEERHDFLMFHTSDQSINTEIFLEMVTPDDVRIGKCKVSELKEVPEEQRASMLAALSKEVSDLCRTGAFEFISELPQDRKAIDSKIVFKIKYKADGTYDKHKGRWVAKGFQAKPGVDFFSTFSPMGSLITVRSLFAVAVALGLEIHHTASFYPKPHRY